MCRLSGAVPPPVLRTAPSEPAKRPPIRMAFAGNPPAGRGLKDEFLGGVGATAVATAVAQNLDDLAAARGGSTR